MIELKNVSKYYTNNGVVTLGLRNINLKLQAGEIVAITGDSGSGKSTLLNVITAVDTYEEGEIYFLGNETSYFNQNDMDLFRKNNVSFIFQNYNIIESYTVLQNVMIPLLLVGKTKEVAKKEAKRIIEKVGLGHRIHHKGTKLSGGEKQRCVIARALASDSKILACDEPTGNLDSQTGEGIIKLIQEVAGDRLVLIVTHNYSQIESIATRRIKIADGEVIEDVHLKEIQCPEVTTKLELEEKKLKKSTFLWIAFQNVFSTPKKTIFTMLVFLVVSFITLLLCLLMLERSNDTYMSYNNSYSLLTKDRLIVYDKDHKPLDKKVLEDLNEEIYYNAFYEETPISINFSDAELYNSLEVCLTNKSMNYDLVEGRIPSKEDEFFIVFPENYWFDTSVIDEKFSLNDGQRVGTIVGCAKSDEVLEYYLLSYDGFSEKMMTQYLHDADITYYYQIEGQKQQKLPFAYRYDGNSNGKSYISCPLKYKDSASFHYYLKEIYELDQELEIRYEDDYDVPTLVNTSNFIMERKISNIYEATIYTHQQKHVIETLQKAGYSVSIPTDMTIRPNVFNLIILYSFLTLTFTALLCMYFISYVILSRVYASKNRDYGILRTLGMIKKQLGKIVILEVVFLGGITAILSLIVFIILYFNTNAFSMGSFLNWWIILIYFIFILIFSYFLARRFNRRLYKFSANTTIKGEVARND